MRLVMHHGQHPVEESCVACGLVGDVTDPAPFAYQDGELQGWVCEDCFGGGAARIRESLISSARDLRVIADNKERLAGSDIQMPSEDGRSQPPNQRNTTAASPSPPAPVWPPEALRAPLGPLRGGAQ